MASAPYSVVYARVGSAAGVSILSR